MGVDKTSFVLDKVTEGTTGNGERERERGKGEWNAGVVLGQIRIRRLRWRGGTCRRIFFL